MLDAKLDAHSEPCIHTESKQLQPEVDPQAHTPRNDFDRFFAVSQAMSEGDMVLAYRLRYQVYCVENNFEDPADFSDGLERDRYDRNSHHALLWHRAGETAVGTVRLITPQGSGFTGLPVNELPDSPFGDMDLPGNVKVAEVSRFCVVKGMRQRNGEDQHADIKWPYEETALSIRRHMPNISLGIMKGVVSLARRLDVSHLCAVMDPALLVLLRRVGINFTPVGPKVDYHGLRQPCHRALADISAEMRESRPELWEVVFGGDGEEHCRSSQPRGGDGEGMDALRLGTTFPTVPSPRDPGCRAVQFSS
ncbi:hypothetical protein CKO28_11745 [Rhodovibrio sodomensis]|uniref:PEP-CTERM/exosortase system-associated acyltransferase n=1 Tax=Rhodovibrio sodomensis TaxID=1088 RepID=A0ABS1DE28_9PROT|nr:PEP-CTERM/exosortase system-associated acyltransferase [Rhodovibrio sodomensis]MBK1668701.1 hypothetical protein [Rhodovibrio sodomensis]